MCFHDLDSRPWQPTSMPLAEASQQHQALYAVLAQIPPGTVASYGQLAQLAGLGRAGRWVGQTLARLPEDSRLPWHRVVAADGGIRLPANSRSGTEQRRRLIAEGILLDQHRNRVNMRQFGWRPAERNG